MLSEIEPLDGLTKLGNADRLTVDGRTICPVPLMFHPDADELLNVEADMTGGEGGWNLKPLPGASCDWPKQTLDMLRHIRAVKGIIQTREMREQDDVTTSPVGQTR